LRILLCSQAPGASHGSCEEGVCLIVVCELFGFGVPVEFSACFHGDGAEMAYSGRAVGDLDRGNSCGAATDAIDEILLVVVTFVKADFIGADV